MWASCVGGTLLLCAFIFFFFNDTATTEIYTLSLHDALPISGLHFQRPGHIHHANATAAGLRAQTGDRKSTRLNSSHLVISYAVFCLKKKKKYRCTSGQDPPAYRRRGTERHLLD